MTPVPSAARFTLSLTTPLALLRCAVPAQAQGATTVFLGRPMLRRHRLPDRSHVATTPCSAQEPEATTRTALLEQEQARKVDELRRTRPDKAEGT